MELSKVISTAGYSREGLTIIDGEQELEFFTNEKIEDYTMPFKLFRYGRIIYSFGSIVKMVGLSIFYSWIGLKLYQRRKMEYNEDSFSSLKMHMIVKSLTLIPILVFVNAINVYSDSMTAIVIAIILCAVYYLIFDIVSKRKVNGFVTVCTFIVTVLAIQISMSIIKEFSLDDETNYEVDIGNIKSFSIGENSKFYKDYYSSDTSIIFDGDYFLKDGEIFNILLEEKYLDDYDYYSNREYINITIKTKSGKMYNFDSYLTEARRNEIIGILMKNEKYMNHIQKIYGKTNGIIKIDDEIVNNQLDKESERSINNNIDWTARKKINSYGWDYSYRDKPLSKAVTKTIYYNHQYISFYIPIQLEYKN